MSRIKAVFFDLDDTLCDDASAWRACACKAAELGASHAPEIDVPRLVDEFLQISERYWISLEPIQEKRALKDVRAEQWREALTVCGINAPPDLATLMADEYGRRRSTEIALFPDAIPTLQALRAAGLKLALLTNGLASTHVEKVAHLGLESLVDHVVIAGALGHFKPDAPIFHYALNLCEAAPDEAIMVGDDPANDIAGAQVVGIKAFWFNPGGKAYPQGLARPEGGELARLSDIMPIVLDRSRL
jgi:2-haloalkanoic acid dehalogenase type II